MSRTQMIAYARDEWLLIMAAIGLGSTSLWLQRTPTYTRSDFEILYILLVLFIITKGLQEHHVLENIARRIEHGKRLAVKLVLLTFFFSMVVTNDVALLSIVPLTLLLRIENKLWLVILEALAANAGSAFSPFGNPQNLFIYWYYHVPASDFITTILPFSLFFLIALLIAAAWLRIPESQSAPRKALPLSSISYFYLIALAIFALSILRILPLSLGGIVLLFALMVDRGSLRVDYSLLLTFFCFFGFTDNLSTLLSTFVIHPHHIFLLSASLSQVISNVPAALLVADFTPHWQPLLWGVSVGGFGTLVGSLANLIAYRVYVRTEKDQTRAFLGRFHVASFSAFFLGLGLYYLLQYIAL